MEKRKKRAALNIPLTLVSCVFLVFFFLYLTIETNSKKKSCLVHKSKGNSFLETIKNTPII